ncbi:unnamed protein product [Rhizoctonia solani]|uniref:Uncharacterized protein n=1 Tax=Rhizoctonia solani TaxID=456999 RepID=A0A8H3HGP0_9AGAM|nr:unnamed protein product [Rhizoctonia solani]
MDSTFRSSESLPYLHSFQSLQKRLNDSHHSSVHLLAYLNPESSRSMKSVTSHDLNEVHSYVDGPPGGPVACHEAWWGDFIDLKPFKLRPLSNFGVDLTPSKVPRNEPDPPHPRTAPARPRRRPPPLELDPIIINSGKENVAPSSVKLPSKPKLSANETEFDSFSPWFILNQFPTPPTTPSIIRRSKTNTSLHKSSRKVNNTPSSPTPVPNDYPKEQVEDRPALHIFRKKRQSSFGSLGKVFKTTSTPIPCTPPPIPPTWLHSDPMRERDGETKPLSALQRRDTFKSRLFSIGASPRAAPRDLGAGGRKLPSQPSCHTISRHGNRTVSESERKNLVLRQASKPIQLRSRSMSQPTQPKDKDDKVEPDTAGPDQDIPPLPIDLEKHLIIPERRTQSPSYINLYVPPWKQVGSSPTQTSFSVEGGVPSTPTTPIGGKFELPDEIMHLPASGSVQSLAAELDPFGAGEPASFFRSEYEAPMGTIEVDSATTTFYTVVGSESGNSRRRRLIHRPAVMHLIPDIIVSSSGGLEELKRRKWPVSG